MLFNGGGRSADPRPFSPPLPRTPRVDAFMQRSNCAWTFHELRSSFPKDWKPPPSSTANRSLIRWWVYRGGGGNYGSEGGVKNDSNIVHSLFCHGYPLIPFFFSSGLNSDCSGSIPHYWTRHPGFPFQGLKRDNGDTYVSVHERKKMLSERGRKDGASLLRNGNKILDPRVFSIRSGVFMKQRRGYYSFAAGKTFWLKPTIANFGKPGTGPMYVSLSPLIFLRFNPLPSLLPSPSPSPLPR